MDVLSQCRPERVFYYFERICRIPHGSGNTKQISDFCMEFARSQGLSCRQDEHNNVVIVKPATPNCQQAPGLILQGHLDMVCEKDSDSPVDLQKEGLQLAVDGDWVFAKGTTLGADDGIAVAMILAILEDQALSHPRLEAVFTTDEETGMFGAAALDVSDLQGRTLINLDSEEEGVLTVSCAGGLRAQVELPVQREPYQATKITLRIEGLQGGHSGAQIHEGRGSSNQLMARLLDMLQQTLPLGLVELTGGNKDNVIPSITTAVIAINASNLPELSKAVADVQALYSQEFAVTDPGVVIVVENGGLQCMNPLKPADTQRVICGLLNAPYGVQAMSADLPGLVATSINLGILRLDADRLRADFSLRSSCAGHKVMLLRRLESLFGMLGGQITTHGDYPAWTYLRQSALRRHMIEIYEQMFGNAPKVEAIHAGLECGLFAGKFPQLDAVSLGPDILEIHTPRERLSIASTARTYAYVCQVLQTWA